MSEPKEDLGKFYAATGVDQFKFVNHNKTDYSAFRDAQILTNERFEEIRNDNSKQIRQERLIRWDENTPARWRGASLAKMDTKSAVKAKSILKANGPGSFFISGDPGAGKTHLGYAILRKYIGAGKLIPAQVKRISEETLMSYAMNGFKGRAEFDELLSSKYKAYLIDNAGAKDSYDPIREAPFWEQLIEHIYANSLIVVITSNETASTFAKILNASGKSKLQGIMKGRTLFVEGDSSHLLEDFEDEMDGAQNSTETKSVLAKRVLDKFDG